MNRVREIRQEKLMSKAELGRRAGLSAVTIDRIEEGKACRVDTMRKIILGLGLSLEDRQRVFGPFDGDGKGGRRKSAPLPDARI